MKLLESYILEVIYSNLQLKNTLELWAQKFGDEYRKKYTLTVWAGNQFHWSDEYKIDTDNFGHLRLCFKAEAAARNQLPQEMLVFTEQGKQGDNKIIYLHS